MPGEQHVRREPVAQGDHLVRERARQRDRVRLLEIAPEVGLDVDDRQVVSGGVADPPQEQLVVRPVSAHRRGVAQVGQILLQLV